MDFRESENVKIAEEFSADSGSERADTVLAPIGELLMISIFYSQGNILRRDNAIILARKAGATREQIAKAMQNGYLLRKKMRKIV